VERRNQTHEYGPEIEIAMNEDEDLNNDLSLTNTASGIKRQGTKNRFNVPLKSKRGRHGLGNTSDFGHAFAPKATSLKRKDSTCSANSSRKGLTKNSSSSSLFAVKERDAILRDKVNYNLIDENTEKGMKQKIKLKKEEIERANKEFERIKEILWINQKKTSHELNNWTLSNAVYSQYRQMMDKQIIPLFSGEKQDTISSHYMSTQQ
jgi:hypothetical protein